MLTKGSDIMIEPMAPNIDILMKLLYAEVMKMQMTTSLQEEASVLEFIWDNLEHQLVSAGLIERNYEY